MTTTHPYTITLVCYKCTREVTYSSDDFENFSMENAVQLAKSEGWVMDGERPVCPKCPCCRIEVTNA